MNRQPLIDQRETYSFSSEVQWRDPTHYPPRRSTNTIKVKVGSTEATWKLIHLLSWSPKAHPKGNPDDSLSVHRRFLPIYSGYSRKVCKPRPWTFCRANIFTQGIGTRVPASPEAILALDRKFILLKYFISS